MALNYQTILEKDFSSGINKLAAEDVVPQSFVEDMQNMDPNAQGYVEKRKGYQSYAGSLPLRVAKAERNADGILFLYFDELEGGTANIDFSTLKPSPVILYGTTTLKTATAATSYYYSAFTVDPRVVLGTPTTLQAADIGATTRDIFIGLGYNSSEDEAAGNKNNEIVYATTVSVDPTTFNVTIDSIEGMTGQVKCYVYIKNHATLAGESWADTISEDTAGSGTFTVNQALHQLNTQNYITRHYDPVSGEEIFPDSVVVTGSTIVTQFTGQAKPSSVRMVIRAVPEIDVATGRTAKKDDTTTLSIPIDADFAFFDVYEEVGSTYSRVFPDKIYINDGTAEITLRNETADNVKLKIVWERASVRTNKLALADTGTAGVDLSPQLCLYGLDHAVLYPDNPKRAGWVTHIDSYKSEGENYLVAGLGWNLFKAVYDSSLPSRQPLLRTSVATQATVGPLFGPAGRDRKSYRFTGGAEGWANIVSITYQASTGWTRVVVSTPDRVATDKPTAGVDPEHDRLTIQSSSQKVHRGEWAIMAFDDSSADTLTFDVMNPNVDSSDYDEDSVGEAGCFTDKVTFVTPSNLVYSLHYGDILEGDAFPMGLSGSLSCVSTVGNVSWLTGVGEVFSFPEGQIYTVRKTGRILQFRDINNPASNPFENFVAGDVLRFSDRTRRHRIHKLVSDNLTGITVSVDGELGETTITNVNSANLVVDQWILLSSAGRFSGEYRVKELPNTSTIVLDSSNVKDTSTPTSFSGPYVSGRTVELGYEDEFTDDANSLLTVRVGLRWFPIENPAGSPSRVKHFESQPYSDQSFVRSVMAQDNMYFANYNDHLLKYDGQSLFRSGLVRWQPGIFAVADEDHVGKIIVPQQISVGMATNKDALYLAADSNTIGAFSVETEINIANSSLNPYTITAIDTSTNKIFLNKQTTDVPTGTTTNVKITQYQPNMYRYYFRLTAYDANDNVVTSATTGSNEFYVSLRKSSAINLRLIGLPKFEQLNYSKVYLEVYRTKRNSVAPFYNIIKKKLDFDPAYPYIDIVDTVSDEALPSQPDDAVLTFISGERLGNGLSQPPQAKYCTVADNKLVLGNIQDDPKITIDVFGNPELSAFNSQVFHMRKDNTSTTNDLTYELTTELIPVTNASLSNVISPTMSLTYTASTSTNNFVVGEWVYVYHTSLPTQGLFYGCGWQKVTSSNATQFTITLPYEPVPAQETITITDGVETASGAGFVVGDKLALTSVNSVYKYTKIVNQAEPGADYFVVTAKSTATSPVYTIQHYSYFSSTTIEENIDTANNPSGFVLGAYLLFNSSNSQYTLATLPLTTVNYHRITKIIPGGTGNTKYVITHYHYPENIARCSAANRNSKCFPVFLGTDYNYGWKNANNDLLYSAASRALLRLSNAMNFSQAIQSSPWFFTNAGLDLGGQSLLISFPENSLKTTPEIVMPASINGIEYYGNKIKVSTASENVGAVTTKFPSRLVISYTNFAEVFHRPFDDSATFSDSIVDVNPADGQEITGVFPFFSESAYGAALKSASLIVFKSNSIYIVDPASRRAQQIESNGLGCTAPYSIAATREGLMFANEAGLYRLTRSLTVEPIGSFIDRLWREDVNKSQLALLQGHAYSVGRKYKVSIPRSGESVPQDVLVYDYTREDSKNTYGSWTRYTNHAATGWCNLLEDSFFASTVGRVYKVSNENSKYDYQDDGAEIDGYTIFRALDFGDSAVRKRVLHLLVHYRIPNLEEGQVDIDTATVSMGVNLVDNFLALDTFKLDVPNTPDGLSTLAPNKQVTLRYAVRNPKSLYFQVKIQDNGLHTPLQVTGLSFRVAGLSTEGVTEAAQTTSKE